MSRFPSHVFAAAIEDDVIVFDSLAERYLALPSAISPSCAGDTALIRALRPDAAAALAQAGLLERGPALRRTAALKTPSLVHETIAAPPGKGTFVDLIRFGWAVAVLGWTLRRGTGCRAFGSERATADARVDEDLALALARLDRARRLLPSPRRCLPASLAAARFLRSLGHEVELVFGVRSHPFAAHCWIETGGVVLDDDLDRVRAFTPIAVGVL